MGYRRPDDERASHRIASIRRVLWAILGLNLAVALLKLAWGVATGSAAMQADGFHSLFDGTSNVVGLVGIGLASRPADRGHPYGHRKYETYASAAIGAMLLMAAYGIGSSAVAKLQSGGVDSHASAGSFIVMLLTLAVNITITTWERSVGKRLGSEILVADASHTGSDVIVSLGVIFSLVLVRAGYPLADPIVALLVAVAIVYTAWGVFRQASDTLADRSRIEPEEICAAVMKCHGVLGCHHVRTRGLQAEVYVDLHVQVDETRSVADGHRIAEDVERMLVEKFPTIVDAIVHLEPYDEYQAEKTAKELDGQLS